MWGGRGVGGISPEFETLAEARRTLTVEDSHRSWEGSGGPPKAKVCKRSSDPLDLLAFTTASSSLPA